MKNEPEKQTFPTVKIPLLKNYPVPTSLSEYLGQLAHYYETRTTNDPPKYLTMTVDRPNLTGTLSKLKEYE